MAKRDELPDATWDLAEGEAPHRYVLRQAREKLCGDAFLRHKKSHSSEWLF